MESRELIGRNVRAQRLRLDLTQEAVAQRAGMHPVEVGRIERGVRDFRVSTLVKLARGLDCPASALLEGVE
jgi:transcriptional regulator with XRE-family HTH domain